MRPDGLKTKIFLDSGDPAETREALSLLGFLDGQTTNPTLIAKNPYAKERFDKGEKFTKAEIFDFYKQVITEISGLIPDGSVSIEVYADPVTTADQMFQQGQDMNGWIPNAHIKYPVTAAGLVAAERSIKAGLRVNMTLCFSQAQAAAVYASTKGAKSGDVFVSPFIGRLDDIDTNGLNLIANIATMYRDSDGHTELLAASVRTLDHFTQSLNYGADIITAPLNVLKEWAAGRPLPDPAGTTPTPTSNLQAIPYQDLDLNQPWQSFDIHHPLTDKGIRQFASDWNQLIR